MDNERRGSISEGSKWGKDYSYEDIMSKDEAYKAVYADVPDQGKADADDAPEPSVEADEDEVFNDWVEDFSEEVNDGEPELIEEQESSGEPVFTEESEPTEESELTEESEPTEESEIAEESEPADESDQTEEPEQAEEPGSTVEPVPGGDEPVPIDPEKQKKRRMLIGGIAGLCVVALIAGSQIHKHYKEFYTTHFFNGTVINGEDASKKTVEEVKDDIKKNVSHYNLKIKELNRDEKITAQDVGLEYVDDGKVDELMEEQEEGKWFLHLAGTTEFDVNAGTKYDEGKLTETIAGLECFKEENVTKPQNATLKDENNVFSIQDEVEGNEVNLEKFTAAVKEALDKGGTSIDIVKNDCYNHPTIYRDNETLKARMDKWNEYMRVNVTYAFGDNIEVVNADTVKPNVVDDGSTVDLPTDWMIHSVLPGSLRHIRAKRSWSKKAVTTDGASIRTSRLRMLLMRF